MAIHFIAMSTVNIAVNRGSVTSPTRFRMPSSTGSRGSYAAKIAQFVKIVKVMNRSYLQPHSAPDNKGTVSLDITPSFVEMNRGCQISSGKRRRQKHSLRRAQQPTHHFDRTTVKHRRRRGFLLLKQPSEYSFTSRYSCRVEVHGLIDVYP